MPTKTTTLRGDRRGDRRDDRQSTCQNDECGRPLTDQQGIPFQTVGEGHAERLYCRHCHHGDNRKPHGDGRVSYDMPRLVARIERLEGELAKVQGVAGRRRWLLLKLGEELEALGFRVRALEELDVDDLVDLAKRAAEEFANDVQIINERTLGELAREQEELGDRLRVLEDSRSRPGPARSGWLHARNVAATVGRAIGRAMARDVLADDLPREWTGLDPQDGDRALAAGIVAGTEAWDEMLRAARAAYIEALGG